MSSGQLVIAELMLVLALTLGFGFQQLWSLRREKQKDASKFNSVRDRAQEPED